MSHAALLLIMWLTLYIVSEPQRNEFRDFVSRMYHTYNRRKRLKSSIRIYRRLYDNTKSDYLRGFYYGKTGLLKSELSEIRYFQNWE